jgi:hypothetical protein
MRILEDLKSRGSIEDCFIHGDSFVISNRGKLLGIIDLMITKLHVLI